MDFPDVFYYLSCSGEWVGRRLRDQPDGSKRFQDFQVVDKTVVERLDRGRLAAGERWLSSSNVMEIVRQS